MDKEATKQNRKNRKKERKYKEARIKTPITLTIVERLKIQAKKELTKQQQINFIITWSSLEVRKAGNKFHRNFKVGMQAVPLGYRGVNFGSTTDRQKQAQQ